MKDMVTSIRGTRKKKRKLPAESAESIWLSKHTNIYIKAQGEATS